MGQVDHHQIPDGFRYGSSEGFRRNAGESAVFDNYVPTGPLSAYIHCFWMFEGMPTAHPRERLVPDGSMQMVINLATEALTYCDEAGAITETTRNAMVSGMRAKPFLIETGSTRTVMGVHFKPGGAVPFLGRIPANLFTDRSLPVGTFWNHDAALLREQLLETRSRTERFGILERALTQKLVPQPRHPAVSYALGRFRTMPGVQTIADAVQKTGWSHRRFIEVFKHQIGLTPKLYCRVMRFQRTLALLRRPKPLALAEIAHYQGYYDQAHFTKEFRAFAGMSPGDYLRLDLDHPNHIPVVAE